MTLLLPGLAGAGETTGGETARGREAVARASFLCAARPASGATRRAGAGVEALAVAAGTLRDAGSVLTARRFSVAADCGVGADLATFFLSVFEADSASGTTAATEVSAGGAARRFGSGSRAVVGGGCGSAIVAVT
jgi:hypothetical protein